ncbi:MAG: hypothetical protein V4793_18090, partial [Paraburkholderia tropica]
MRWRPPNRLQSRLRPKNPPPLSVRNPLVSQAAPDPQAETLHAAPLQAGALPVAPSKKRSKRERRADKRAAVEASVAQAPILEIESLDMEARGVGRTVTETGEPGKVIFVEGALPGERVTYLSYRKKPTFEQAEVVSVLRESAIRTKPQCPYFGKCGGCSMQHLDVRAQIAVKQRVLEDNLQHLSKVRSETMFRPIHGPSWGYRYRARLTVRNVPKKGGVLVGFH